MQTKKRHPSRLSSSGQRPRRGKKLSFWQKLSRMKPQGFAVCFGALAVGGYLLFSVGSWVVKGISSGPDSPQDTTGLLMTANGSAGEEFSAGWDQLPGTVASAARSAAEAAKLQPVSLRVPLSLRTEIPAGADEIVVPSGIPALPEETKPAPEAEIPQKPAEEQAPAETAAAEKPAESAPAVTVTTTGSENLSYWRSVNSDVIGWLKVPTTNINYPVVKGPNTNYYIDKDIYGNYSVNGVIWADSDIRTGSGSQLSNNTVIYGHNWTNYSANPSVGRSGDVMFAQLTSLQHLWVAQQIPYIYFSTPEEDMAWQVFAAFYTDTNLDYIVTDPGSSTMQYIIDEAIARSEHVYDVSVSASDKILTLSTCTRRFGARSDQRFVVMAKLMDSTSNLPSVSITANSSPKRPQF